VLRTVGRIDRPDTGARRLRRFIVRGTRVLRLSERGLERRTVKRRKRRARALESEHVPEGGSPSLAELPANN